MILSGPNCKSHTARHDACHMLHVDEISSDHIRTRQCLSTYSVQIINTVVFYLELLTIVYF
jgi:hypothetical protein